MTPGQVHKQVHLGGLKVAFTGKQAVKQNWHSIICQLPVLLLQCAGSRIIFRRGLLSIATWLCGALQIRSHMT